VSPDLEQQDPCAGCAALMQPADARMVPYCSRSAAPERTGGTRYAPRGPGVVPAQRPQHDGSLPAEVAHRQQQQGRRKRNGSRGRG
jgi:hypothetical protein